MRFLLCLIILLLCEISQEQNLGIKNNKVIKNATVDEVHTLTDTVLENRFLDTLMKIGIIKRNNSYIDSVTNHNTVLHL